MEFTVTRQITITCMLIIRLSETMIFQVDANHVKMCLEDFQDNTKPPYPRQLIDALLRCQVLLINHNGTVRRGRKFDEFFQMLQSKLNSLSPLPEIQTKETV